MHQFKMSLFFSIALANSSPVHGYASPKADAPSKDTKKSSQKEEKKKITTPRHELIDSAFLKKYNHALKSFQSGQFDQTIQLATNILTQWKGSPRTLALLGAANKSKKKFKAAIQYFQRAAVLFDTKREFFEKSQALYNIAFSYEYLGERLKAIGAWKNYAVFSKTYIQESSHVQFAQTRIDALKKVKVKEQ